MKADENEKAQKKQKKRKVKKKKLTEDRHNITHTEKKLSDTISEVKLCFHHFKIFKKLLLKLTGVLFLFLYFDIFLFVSFAMGMSTTKSKKMKKKCESGMRKWMNEAKINDVHLYLGIYVCMYLYIRFICFVQVIS